MRVKAVAIAVSMVLLAGMASNEASAQYGVAYPGYPSTGGSYNSGYASGSMYYAPGGYDARIGSPYYYYGGEQGLVSGDPYVNHFGTGFQRSAVHGHYRFPYYNYRAPWYYPGRAVYNRDTNFPW